MGSTTFGQRSTSGNAEAATKGQARRRHRQLCNVRPPFVRKVLQQRLLREQPWTVYRRGGPDGPLQQQQLHSSRAQVIGRQTAYPTKRRKLMLVLSASAPSQDAGLPRPARLRRRALQAPWRSPLVILRYRGGCKVGLDKRAHSRMHIAHNLPHVCNDVTRTSSSCALVRGPTHVCTQNTPVTHVSAAPHVAQPAHISTRASKCACPHRSMRCAHTE